MDINSNISSAFFCSLFFLLLLLFFCSNCPICLQIAGGLFLFDILTYCRHTQMPLCRFCCGWNHLVSPRGYGHICIVRLESISTTPFPGLSNTQCVTENVYVGKKGCLNFSAMGMRFFFFFFLIVHKSWIMITIHFSSIFPLMHPLPAFHGTFWI